VIFLNIEANS